MQAAGEACFEAEIQAGRGWTDFSNYVKTQPASNPDLYQHYEAREKAAWMYFSSLHNSTSDLYARKHALEEEKVEVEQKIKILKGDPEDGDAEAQG
jgi:hypothetical protein